MLKKNSILKKWIHNGYKFLTFSKVRRDIIDKRLSRIIKN